MIVLDGTSKSLSVVLGSSVAAHQLTVVATYVDLAPTSFVPAEQDTLTNDTTPVTIVASPATATQRQVKYIAIFNSDTAPATVSVGYVNGANTRTMLGPALQVGSTLMYTDGDGWFVLDASGRILEGSGDFMNSRFGIPFPDSGVAVGFIATDGTMAGGNLDSSGNLLVAVTGAGSGGTSSVDEAAFSAGVTAGTPAMGVYEASPTALTSGQLGIVELDANRNQKVNLATPLPAGTNVIGHVIADTGSTTAVTGNVTVVQGTASNLKTQATGAGTAGTADAGVLTVQGIASMTKLLVTPDANSAINLAQVGGSSVATGHGTASGAIRVELPTDGTGVVGLAAGSNLIGNVGNGKTIKSVTGSISSATDIVALVSSKRLKVIAYKLMTVYSAGAIVPKFYSNGTGGTLLDESTLQALSGVSVGVTEQVPAPSFLFATVAGEKLTLDPNGQTVTYRVTYFDDDAT